MKKMDIERMQRLEDLVERQKHQISGQEIYIEKLQQEGLKLVGANEALTELIVRLKKGE